MNRIALGAAVVAAATWSGGAAAQNGQTAEGASYQVRLQDLHDRVEQLHEQLRRMQNRQKLLGAAAPSAVASVPTEIELEDDTTSALLLTGVRVWIDGALVYERTEAAAPRDADGALPVFVGTVTPGRHSVQVDLRLSGNGAILPYMRAYRFEVKDAHAFVAAEGHPATLVVHAFERGDATTPFDQRPAVGWDARYWGSVANRRPHEGLRRTGRSRLAPGYNRAVKLPRWIPQPVSWATAVALFFFAAGVSLAMAFVIPLLFELMRHSPRLAWLGILAVWLAPSRPRRASTTPSRPCSTSATARASPAGRGPARPACGPGSSRGRPCSSSPWPRASSCSSSTLRRWIPT